MGCSQKEEEGVRKEGEGDQVGAILYNMTKVHKIRVLSPPAPLTRGCAGEQVFWVIRFLTNAESEGSKYSQSYVSIHFCVHSQCSFFLLALRFEMIKVHIFEEGHKILQNLHQLFVLCTASQIIGGDFGKFCGLLRIYEL